METFSEVVFFLHDIGQAFMADIEKINKRLYIALLQQVHTDHFLVVNFMVIVVCGKIMSQGLFGSIFLVIF